MTDWNTLVEWVGEAGSGTWDRFKETIRWIAADDLKLRDAPHIAALRLSGLAYLELDWDNGHWIAAEPCITLLPSSGGRGVLLGARTRTLLKHLEAEISDEVTLGVEMHRTEQDSAPDAIYFTADLGELEALASRLGIAFQFNVSERLSRILPHLDHVLALGKTNAPPPQGFEIHKWTAPRWQTCEFTTAPGLYRQGSWGRRRYWFFDGASFFSVDGPTGFYAELRRSSGPVLTYRRESINGTMFRPIWAPLPLLQERALVLCSGLVPQEKDPGRFGDRRVRYENVPLDIARRVAASLDAGLEMLR